MKIFKNSFFYLCLAGLIGCILILAIEFFPPCDKGHGSGIYCPAPTGTITSVDQPAIIQFFSFEPFTVSYLGEGNQTTDYEAICTLGIVYSVDVQTASSTQWLMKDASGGMVDSPLVRVEKSSDQYPGLVVYRTFYRPLKQLFDWYLFPAFLAPLSWFIIFLIALIDDVRPK